MRESSAAPHAVFGLTGAPSAKVLPTALEAALAYPDRHVMTFVTDESGLYTVQALWSMALVVVCANHDGILQIVLARAGISASLGPWRWLSPISGNL